MTRPDFNKPRLLASLLVAAAAAAIAPSASAFDERKPWSSCIDVTASAFFFNGGNSASANSVVLSCPVTDNASLPHWLVANIHFYYDDRSTGGSIQAARCIEFANASGATCGNTVSSPFAGTGIGSLVVPNAPAAFATTWNSVFGHFAYINAILPPTSAGNISRVKGYWQSH